MIGGIVAGLNHVAHRQNPPPPEKSILYTAGEWVTDFFDYNGDGQVAGWDYALGAVDVGITIFDIVTVPSGEGVAAHIALKEGAKTIAKNTVKKTVNRSTIKAAKQAKIWLGKDCKVITNKAGDNIFISKDGLRKIRFDIKNLHGDKPHIHLEVFRKGKWRDALSGQHRIYPK